MEGSEFVIQCDAIIPAIGQEPESGCCNECGVEVGRRGRIVTAGSTMQTSAPDVFCRRRCGERAGDGDRSRGSGPQGGRCNRSLFAGRKSGYPFGRQRGSDRDREKLAGYSEEISKSFRGLK